MTESVPKSKFIIFEQVCADFQPNEKKNKRMKKQTKNLLTLKCTCEDRLLGFIWKKTNQN